MSDSKPGQQGNGCLYGLLGLGVLMVVAGVALEALPELPDPEPDRGYDPYAQPAYEPPPPPPPPPEDPQADIRDRIQDILDERAGAQAEGDWTQGELTTLLWAAEGRRGGEVVPAVLWVTVSRDGPWQARRAGVRTADGSESIVDVMGGARLDGAVTRAGTVFQVTLTGVDGANRIEVNTTQHRLLVPSLGLDGALYVEHLSAPHPDGPGTRTAEVQASLSRLAVPTMVTGAIPQGVALVRGTGRSPRAADPVCELLGGPTITSTYNCRVVLRCNGEVIYGAGTTGYNRCDLAADSTIVRANDDGTTSENQDPRFLLDVSAGTLTVSDDTPQPWSAIFELIDDPRCLNPSTFRGQSEAPGGPGRVPWVARPLSDPPTVTSAYDPVGPLASVQAICGRGELSWTLSDGVRAQLHMAPSARLVLGYAGPDRWMWGFAETP